MEKNRYHCHACDKTVTRESSKTYIESWCEETQKNVSLVRVDGEE